MNHQELPPLHGNEARPLGSLSPEQVEGLLDYMSQLYMRQVEIQQDVDPFAHDAIRRAAVENRLPTPDEYEAAIKSAKAEGALRALQEVARKWDSILASNNAKPVED